MIKILEVNPNTNDAMSFYRGRGPLAELQKKYASEMNIGFMGTQINTNWDFLSIFHAVFILRPFGEEHRGLMRVCNQYNIPVWIDYDDLLTDVPQDNPAFLAYGNDYARSIIKEILELCTVCTFSTKFLMNKMGKDILHKSLVIPNAHNSAILRNPISFTPHKKVVWRGSHTHERDLEQFEGPIREVLRKQSDWKIEFMGMNPIRITDHVEARYTPYMDKTRYFRYLSELEGSINIVPLSHRSTEIDFNKSKSNIAWMEATYGGLVCLAPDWEEWRKPGIINYKGNTPYEAKKDMHDKLTAMIEGKYDLKSLHQQSWQYIQDNLKLEQTNEIRYNLIQSRLMPDCKSVR